MFSKVHETKKYAVPFNKMASSAKRISNTFRKGAKAMLVAISGANFTPEVKQVIDELDQVSDDSDDSDLSETDSLGDAMANKIYDANYNGAASSSTRATRGASSSYRSRSPGNRKKPAGGHSRH